MEMFANLECPYNKSKHFTLTYDDIRPPQCHAHSSLSTPSSKKQGHEPLRAVSGMSHITTPFKKKSSLPLTAILPPHPPQTALSKQTRRFPPDRKSVV